MHCSSIISKDQKENLKKERERKSEHQALLSITSAIRGLARLSGDVFGPGKNELERFGSSVK